MCQAIMPTSIHQYKKLHKPVKPALTISASHDLAHHQNCLLENNMFRLLKALPLTLSLAVLSIFAISCGSGSQSQIRVVHAISNGPALDVNVNATKVFTNIAFGGVQPIPPAYTKVPSGGVTIQAFDTGTTTNPIFGTNGVTANFSSSSQYTIVLAGILNGTGTNALAALQITDNNSAPTSGNVEFRIIHASPSGTTPVDVYIVPPGTDITNVTPQIGGSNPLAYQQASTYVSIGFSTNGYSVILTANGSKTPLFNPPYGIAPPTGSIRTLVLVDLQNGGAMSPTPTVLSDLN
jgi:hypothetical protein